MTRRQFMGCLAMGASLLRPRMPAAGMRQEPGSPRAEDPSSPFTFAQVQYRGGDWDPHPSAALELLKEVDRRTSIGVSFQRYPLTLSDPDLFSYPFLYWTGALEFTPFTDAELARLRRFLSFGGFMLVNDAGGYRGSPFDRRFREEVRRLFPEQALERRRVARRGGGDRVVEEGQDGRAATKRHLRQGGVAFQLFHAVFALIAARRAVESEIEERRISIEEIGGTQARLAGGDQLSRDVPTTRLHHVVDDDRPASTMERRERFFAIP